MAKELLKRIKKREKYLKLENKEKDFEFQWEGCLKHIKKKYSSVKLQHKALEWW